MWCIRYILTTLLLWKSQKGNLQMEQFRLSKIGLKTVFFTCFMLFSFNSAMAAHVLIVNGSSTTSEVGTTAAITANLDTLHQAVGNTTDIQDIAPANLTAYDEIWDIRFSNSSPITSAQQTQYVAFLQGAGRMFVMGENASFPTRNNSVFGLISALGGGSLTFVTPGSTQTVNAPFDQPNLVSQISYSAPGGVTTAGSGVFMTSIGVAPGTGIAFSPGTLSNASAGTLTAVFDVNFMQGDTNGTADNIQFFKNLINFVTAPPIAPIPSLSPLGLLLLISILGFLSIRYKGQLLK